MNSLTRMIFFKLIEWVVVEKCKIPIHDIHPGIIREIIIRQPGKSRFYALNEDYRTFVNLNPEWWGSLHKIVVENIKGVNEIFPEARKVRIKREFRYIRLTLKKLINPRDLTLWCTFFGGRCNLANDVISKLSNLETLRIYFVPFGLKVFNQIFQNPNGFPNLKRLIISGCNLDVRELEISFQTIAPNLEILDLNDNFIDPPGFETLMKCDLFNIRELNLRDNCLQDIPRDELISQIQTKYPNITTIDV